MAPSRGFGPLTAAELAGRDAGRDARGASATAPSVAWPSECADEVDRRFPKVLRRVGGYNLDEFISRNARSTWPK